MSAKKVLPNMAGLTQKARMECFRGVRRSFCTTMSTLISGGKLAEEPRAYFYYIDSRGWVFFEEEEYRNFATALKDKKFLVCHLFMQASIL